MVWPDRVIVVTGGGRDANGDPVPTEDTGPWPAQVTPLRSSETVSHGGELVVGLYRLAIGKPGGQLLKSTSGVKWRGRTYTVQGDVEPWHVHGRLHHYEATLRI